MTEILPVTVPSPPAFPMARSSGCPLDPPPLLSEIQHEAPVCRVRLWDGSTPWLVTRYEDLRELLGDPRVSADSQTPGYPHVSAASAARRVLMKPFVSMDQPEHMADRRLLAGEFVPRKVAALRPLVREIVEELTDQLLDGPRPADLVGAFALPISARVLCGLLGVPFADREFLYRCVRVIFARHAAPDVAVATTQDLIDYLGELIEARRRSPEDDLISRLAVGQLGTGNRTREEIVSMVLLVLVAGFDTTANQIALGTMALLANPDQLAAVRDSDDPAFLAGAVEELLRYVSVFHLGVRRAAKVDIEINGQLIRRHEGVIAASHVANRDPSVFPDPDRLDVHRAGARNHVAFGYGPHQCLGQSLARVELQIVLGTLCRRIPTLALARPISQLSYRDDFVVYGVDELLVTW